MKNQSNNLERYRVVSDKIKIIGHPDRLRILDILTKRGAQNITQLYEELEIPQSTVSQHMSKLKMLNLVHSNRKGLEVYYDINDAIVLKVIKLLNIENA